MQTCEAAYHGSGRSASVIESTNREYVRASGIALQYTHRDGRWDIYSAERTRSAVISKRGGATGQRRLELNGKDVLGTAAEASRAHAHTG